MYVYEQVEDIASYDWVSNNATIGGSISSGTVTSLFDFTNATTTGNVTNIYIQNSLMNATCTQSHLSLAASQGQLFPPNYLQQNALYGGQETIHGIGASYKTDKWIIFIGTTVVSFYFTPEGDWVRYDENAPGMQTSVVTWLYNFNNQSKFSSDVFSFTSCR
ncbi:hypothetical protein BZG36_00597 [Bifiguratus adelaidae]|uniref:Uncharacterized protein n=1 Tax=Bifiguratus adelaidae TaxID=1938954 RepID=A0A261Y776_9FUNG|nr:hypothetical protein BZG36_00597 [Bifiguratus adelaidae]